MARTAHKWLWSDGIEQCCVDPDFDDFDGDLSKLSSVPLADVMLKPAAQGYDFKHCNKLVESYRRLEWEPGMGGPPAFKTIEWTPKRKRGGARRRPRPIRVSAYHTFNRLNHYAARGPEQSGAVVGGVLGRVSLSGITVETRAAGVKFTNTTTGVWVDLQYPVSHGEVFRAAEILMMGKSIGV